MENRRILVAGGGPAGLMAAYMAAEKGARVTLLEKMDRPGRKLALTGNGRCNITNTAPLERFLAAYGGNGSFLRQAFHRFFNGDLRDFLSDHGVDTREEEDGKVYLADSRAESAVALFERLLSDRGVDLRLASAVEKLEIQNNAIQAAVLRTGERLETDALVLAVGGASFPGTGSSGDGFTLARSLGHTVVPIRPGLVPLIVSDPTIPELMGVRVDKAGLTLLQANSPLHRTRGDLLFTHFGLSGPAIHTLSSRILPEPGVTPPEIELDWLPEEPPEMLEKKLIRAADTHGKRKVENLLSGLVPDKAAPVLLKRAGLAADTPVHQITKGDRKALVATLKVMKLIIAGTRPLAEAMVTVGGVALNEIEPRSMASRLVKGLYFAGEVMDLDGDTGGFNLQAAFSTGWLAGRSAQI